jgi:hypothetical protein
MSYIHNPMNKADAILVKVVARVGEREWQVMHYGRSNIRVSTVIDSDLVRLRPPSTL